MGKLRLPRVLLDVYPPFAWRSLVDDDRRTYYWNVRTNTTQWAHPNASRHLLDRQRQIQEALLANEHFLRQRDKHVNVFRI